MRITILLLAALALSLPAPSMAQEAEAVDEPTCGFPCNADGSPLSTDTDTPPETALVTQIFIGNFSEACSWAIGGGPGLYEPEIHDLTYRPSYGSPEDPDSPLRLYRFFCGSGAYNERHAYLIWTPDSGVRPAGFAVPTYEVTHVGGDTDAALEGISVTGMYSRRELVNSIFDPATRTVTEWSCWRGLCDASGRGEWVLDDGDFRLVSYDVDPTYDGEVNLFRLTDLSEPAPVDISTPLPFTPPVLDDEE